MITKVVLTNWRSHLNSELEFSEGTNCLVGRMGSGKSSVLDAICFGLFGTFPQLQQKKIKLEDMIMKKPKAQRLAEIRIEFDSNGDACSVKRRIEKGKSTGAEFRKNGKLVETQSQKVTEEVERILKVDYDLFTRAVYSEQNQLDMFLTIPKGQRMKRIDELLRLDRFESARASAVSLENRFSFAREQKEKTLGDMREDEIMAESGMLKSGIEILRSESDRLFSEAESAAKEKLLLREKITGLEKAREEFHSLSQKISSIERLNQQLGQDISVLERHLAAAYSGSGAEELKEKMDALREEMNFAASDAKKKRERVLGKRLEAGAETARLSQTGELKKEKEKLEALLSGGRLQRLLSELSRVSVELESGAISIASMKNGIKECGVALEGLSSADSRCLVCGHELSEEKKKQLAKESRKRMEILKAETVEAEALMKKLSAERDGIERNVSELKIAEARKKEIGSPEAEGTMQRIAALSGDIARAERELENIERSASSFQAELENLVREYESAKVAALRRAEMLEKRKILEENASEAESLKAKLNHLRNSFSESILREASEKMEGLIGVEKSIEARIAAIAEIISEKRKRLEDAESRKKMAEGMRLEIRKASAMEQQLQLLQRGLEASQERLRKDFVGAINGAMHMIWENLYPYADFSSVRMAVDGDYVLQLQDANGWISVDNVSGGERSIACLALRIAFALVLAPQLRWLVLDEPTHNLDEKAVAELANVLRDSITEFVEQVFLITHDTSLEAAVSGCLYRMEKAKDGFTNVVKVEGE